MERPEYKDKWLQDSPEPQETKVLVNGTSREGAGRDGRNERDGRNGGATGGSAATGTNGVTKTTGAKKFSLGEYKDRKAAGKAPGKTNPLLAAAVTGAGSKNSSVTTGDKKSVFCFYSF